MSNKWTAESREKMSISARKSHPRNGVELSCIICNVLFYAEPSFAKRGAKCCSRQCSCIYRKTPEFRERMREKLVGAKCHFWKGGVTPLNKIDRESAIGMWWRQEIKKRDDFTCQLCRQRGGELHSDHIVPFSLAPELRWVLTNGRTLCVTCHRNTATFGGKMHKLLRLAGVA